MTAQHKVTPAFKPGSSQAAAHGLIDRDVVCSSSFRKRLVKASIEGSEPDILRFSRSMLKEAHGLGWPLFAHQYYRGKEEQERVNRLGNSKAKWGQSPHNHGMAVDIVHFGRYWNLTTQEWALIGLVGKEIARRQNLKITWGGDWKFYDPAHWELADWKTRITKA